MPPDALDVGCDEREAAVLRLERVAVQVHGLGGALLEGGSYDLDDVGDRRHRVALGARSLEAEAARRALHAEAARPRGMDEEVAADQAGDPSHRHAGGRAAPVEVRRWGHADLEARAAV